jgi:hypothetical protein
MLLLILLFVSTEPSSGSRVTEQTFPCMYCWLPYSFLCIWRRATLGLWSQSPDAGLAQMLGIAC